MFLSSIGADTFCFRAHCFLLRPPARAGGVIGAAVAAGVSYYMTATALAALAEERALRREEPASAHGRRHGHAKHAPAAPGGVAATPSKHKHAKASEQARRAVATAAEQAARAGGRDDDDDDDGMGDEDGAASEEPVATPTPGVGDGGGVGGEEDGGAAGVVNNPVYQQRVMADEALPSRAAQRFTAQGQTPDTPAPGSAMYGQYGAVNDEDASAEDGEFGDTVSGLETETGLETEEDNGARRRRGSVGGAGLRVAGRCSTAVTADQSA
jgi:hypothetical protein